MGQRRLIIFAKEPVAGKVKTRLCPPLTHEQAAALYKAFTQDVVRAASEVRRTTVEIAWEGTEREGLAGVPASGGSAVPPSSASGGVAWLGRRAVLSFKQKGDNLGERLIHAFDRAFTDGASYVVVIGTDSPGLTPKDLENAFGALEDGKEAVVGPAEDGGYYLIGLKKSVPALFERISWSTDRVLKETLAAAKKEKLNMELLTPFIDVDTFSDLIRLTGKIAKAQEKYLASTQKALAGIELTV